MTMTASRLDKQIQEARVSVAKSAIGSPNVYPQYSRLCEAKRQLLAAEKELKEARSAWDKLIEAAPPEWKKLAPRV